jgi:hypothetical protein
MQDLHWRYNFNTDQFDFVENNPHQHYEPLLKQVHRPTLVIDCNLVKGQDIEHYVKTVVDRANAARIRFEQIIFDGTQDPVTDYRDKSIILDNIAGEFRIPCFFGLSQFDLTQHQHLKEINYPSWLFVFKKQSLPHEFPGHDRTHAFSCLNRNPTFHRLVFYTMVKDLGLLDKFIYSFYDRCPYQGHLITAYQYRGLANLVGDELAQRCITNIRDFPIAWQSEPLGANDHSLAHPAYQDAWCNVVTETSALISFTSEKIWKPIAAGQLFLVVGAPGTTAWLKRLGFHVFCDDYDLKQNFSSRLHLVAEVVNQHHADTRDWWHANRFHIEHNFHWFHSGNVERQILAPVVALLNGERS